MHRIQDPTRNLQSLPGRLSIQAINPPERIPFHKHHSSIRSCNQPRSHPRSEATRLFPYSLLTPPTSSPLPILGTRQSPCSYAHSVISKPLRSLLQAIFHPRLRYHITPSTPATPATSKTSPPPPLSVVHPEKPPPQGPTPTGLSNAHRRPPQQPRNPHSSPIRSFDPPNRSWVTLVGLACTGDYSFLETVSLSPSTCFQG